MGRGGQSCRSLREGCFSTATTWGCTLLSTALAPNRRPTPDGLFQGNVELSHSRQAPHAGERLISMKL